MDEKIALTLGKLLTTATHEGTPEAEVVAAARALGRIMKKHGLDSDIMQPAPKPRDARFGPLVKALEDRIALMEARMKANNDLLDAKETSLRYYEMECGKQRAARDKAERMFETAQQIAVMDKLTIKDLRKQVKRLEGEVARLLEGTTEGRDRGVMRVIEEIEEEAGGPLTGDALAAALNERGIPAPRGGEWTRRQVYRVRERFEGAL